MRIEDTIINNKSTSYLHRMTFRRLMMSTLANSQTLRQCWFGCKMRTHSCYLVIFSHSHLPSVLFRHITWFCSRLWHLNNCVIFQIFILITTLWQEFVPFYNPKWGLMLVNFSTGEAVFLNTKSTFSHLLINALSPSTGHSWEGESSAQCW